MIDPKQNKYLKSSAFPEMSFLIFDFLSGLIANIHFWLADNFLLTISFSWDLYVHKYSSDII